MDFLIIFGAKYLIVLPALVLIAYFLFSRGKALRQLSWLSVISFPLAFVLSRIAAHLYYDARPFVVDHVAPLIQHAADNGFPSDHMLFAATIATVVLYVNKKAGLFLWIVAVLIGLSRVGAGVHHITDIIGSMVIALIAVIASQFAIVQIRRLQSRLNVR